MKKIVPLIILSISIAAQTAFSATIIKNRLTPAESRFVLEDPSTWRGVNLPLYFNKPVEGNLSQHDFDYAAEAGANIIRLNLFADLKDRRINHFTDEDGTILKENTGMTELNNAVIWAHNAGLKILIDFHSMPGFANGEIWTSDKHWDVFASIWKLIATKLKDDPTVVAYDLMNEPNIVTYLNDPGANKEMFQGSWSPPSRWKGTAGDYNLHIKKIIDDIRTIDPTRWIVIEGFGMLGNPTNFNWMKPVNLDDKHIIYSFHMYVPTSLTNIGTKEFINRNLVGEPFDQATDMRKIDNALAPVIAFQKKYKVPIFVGEFGVTNDAIFKSDEHGTPYNGACWLNVIVNKINELKWGWTFWSFWVDIRKPQSKDDPRYLILQKAFTGETVTGYCK